MKEFVYTYQPEICEQPKITFFTTGHCGGDSGHGGEACLTISMKDGGTGLHVETKRRRVGDSCDEVRVSVFGDWELEGFAIGLMELGRKLLSRDDVIADRK